MGDQANELVELQTERMATGGEAVGRMEDGRVVFVRGATAEETVQVQIDQTKKRFARGTVVEVIAAGVDRVEAPCVHHVDQQCGGCDWQFVSDQAQRRYKQAIVVEQLERLGGLVDPVVRPATHPAGRRTTVRCAVTAGRAGYRARRSEDSFAATACQAVHPLIEELIVDGRYGSASEVTLRLGAATGERMVITDGDPGAVVVPGDVLVVPASEKHHHVLHEVVAGRTWQVSGGSFFQSSLEGAEALVAAVAAGLTDTQGAVADLYAGVGLLGGATVADRLSYAVESNPSSIQDARANLPSSVEIIECRVERWEPTAVASVIADPARRGLGADGASVVDRTGATRLVLVSCDPASLGRDTALLVEQGWRYRYGQMVDLFPDTSRVEVVSVLER